MTSWLITNLGGMAPRRDSRLLPDNAAEEALNTDLDSGAAQGFRIPQLVKDLSAYTGSIGKAYRIWPYDDQHPEQWIPLPSPFSSVVPSPLTNDTFHRYYWTNPDDGAYFSTYPMVQAGTAPYNLGVTCPATDAADAPSVSCSGGTTDGSIPLEDRSYIYTFVDTFGLESAPSLPSAIVSGATDGTWTIKIPPSTQPASPAGFNYPRVMMLRLYRTVTGTTTGAAFYLMRELHYNAAEDGYGEQMPANANTTGITDVLPSTVAVEQGALVTASYANPPAGLTGLVEMPGGMLVGFTGNTLHFCEPYLPHTWPPAYDVAVEHPIVGIAVWQQTLFVATSGSPYSGSGTTPGSFTLSVIRTPEPCISQGSIVVDLMGVNYASPNGLVQLSYFGAQNITAQLITRNEWIDGYIGLGTIACRYRNQYLALLPSSGTGYVIDTSEATGGFVDINAMQGVSCIWSDEHLAKVFMLSNKKVYEWDSPGSAGYTPPQMAFRWRSKKFSLANAASLGACQILLDPTAPTAAANAQVNPFSSTTDTSANPTPNYAATFRLWADETLVLTYNLNSERTTFSLPSGFKAFDYQIEIASLVPVRRIELASSKKELRRV